MFVPRLFLFYSPPPACSRVSSSLPESWPRARPSITCNFDAAPRSPSFQIFSGASVNFCASARKQNTARSGAGQAEARARRVVGWPAPRSRECFRSPNKMVHTFENLKTRQPADAASPRTWWRSLFSGKSLVDGVKDGGGRGRLRHGGKNDWRAL